MPTFPQKIIFDTSAINALEADKDLVAITQSLSVAYKVGIPETTLSEVIACPDELERRRLLDVFKRLLKSGNCIMPFQWIVEEQAKAYQRYPSGYDWKRLDVRFKEGESEIARQEIIHSLSGETRASQKAWEKQFQNIYRDAKPAFQALFEASDKRPSLREVTEKLLAEGGAHLGIGVNLIEKATGTRPSEADTKDFMGRCSPFKALLVALCFAQYDRCIRSEREQSLGKAGRIDILSAVYLPYCKSYVTNDEGQNKALNAVAELMEADISVVLYEDFTDRLFGLKP
jgi:hypothetical protein